MNRILALAVLLFAFPAQAEVNIEWVTVGDPGNPCDVQPQGCFGAVPYVFDNDRYEVTNGQYAEFLNAVAATDTYGLYNASMGSGYGGITRSGSLGSYTYSAIFDRLNMPVNYVSFYDALRFANWLENGQPTGAQDSTTTEDGSYTMITEIYPGGPFITRKAGATIFLTSEDEWFKEVFFDDGYFDYPAGSDLQTACATPGATPNTANCNLAIADLSDVGDYTGSASPSGTFDQGGNVQEWNEAIIGSNRGVRGGSFVDPPLALAASTRNSASPTGESATVGFRIARFVPETPSLNPFALAALCTLLGLAGLRRLRG